jgi:hypothetical protein
MKQDICFKSDTILFSAVATLALIVFVVYFIFHHIKQMKGKVIIKTRNVPVQIQEPSRYLRDSFVRPTRDYFDSRSTNEIGRKVGYIYGGINERLPLFEHLENREYQYFVMDDSRNGNKIEIINPNKREPLYDGTIINSAEFGGDMNVKIYPIRNNLYSSEIN